MRTRHSLLAVLALGAALLAGCSPGARVELDLVPYLQAAGYDRLTGSLHVLIDNARGQEVAWTSDIRAPRNGASVDYAKVEVGPAATGTLHYEFELSPIQDLGEPTRGWVEFSLFVVPGSGSPWGTRVAGPQRFGPASSGARWTWKGEVHLGQTLTRGIASGSATIGILAHPVDYYVRLPDLNGGSLDGRIGFRATPRKLLLTVP